MKKIFIFLVIPLVSLFSLSAQITQEQADNIVIERMADETRTYSIYAKENLQAKFEVTTTTGEALELNYPAWVFYANYTGETNGKYLIVKESNGNVLEINAKNDEGPNNLETWRVVIPRNIPFTEYSLEGTSCQWINLPYDDKVLIVNTNEEIESYINCSDEHYPDIDFSEYTLLLANGIASSSFAYSICTYLQQLSKQNFEMNVEIFKTNATVLTPWQVAVIIDKIDANSMFDLKIKYLH